MESTIPFQPAETVKMESEDCQFNRSVTFVSILCINIDIGESCDLVINCTKRINNNSTVLLHFSPSSTPLGSMFSLNHPNPNQSCQ